MGWSGNRFPEGSAQRGVLKDFMGREHRVGARETTGCVDPRLNQWAAEGRLLRPRPQRACSQAREGFAGKGQGFTLPLGKGLGDSTLLATLL